VVFTVFASRIQAATEPESFWPPGHYFRVYEDITSTGFQDVESPPTIFIVFGLGKPFVDRAGTKDTDIRDIGHAVYAPSFALWDIKTQIDTVSLCEIVLGNSTRLFLDIDPSTGSGIRCGMNSFKKWRLSRGESY